MCIRVCLEDPCQSQVVPEVSYRKLHNIDLESLKSDLLKNDLLTHPENKTYDLYLQYHSTLTDLFNSHAPLIMINSLFLLLNGLIQRYLKPSALSVSWNVVGDALIQPLIDPGFGNR